jgi:N6-L-threonylcarbamoyladenine synthase
MKILSIDTSCDDTSAAVTEGYEVLSNVVSSQVRFHKKYGGVVPMVAARLHEERIESIVTEALQRAKISWKEFEAIAVTYGPGLAPALQVGIAYAKKMSAEYSLPVYAINHMAGHIASCLAVPKGRKSTPLQTPALAFLVSGSHTELVGMEQFGFFKIYGQSLDDAVGEAFDKVGRMLGFGYPGGKVVARLAEQGNSQAYDLPVPMKQSGDANFSYSGLKNAVRLLIAEDKLTKERIVDIAASFQRVAIEHLINKCE